MSEHVCEWCSLPIVRRPLDGPAVHIDGAWWHRSCIGFALAAALRRREAQT